MPRIPIKTIESEASMVLGLLDRISRLTHFFSLRTDDNGLVTIVFWPRSYETAYEEVTEFRMKDLEGLEGALSGVLEDILRGTIEGHYAPTKLRF